MAARPGRKTRKDAFTALLAPRRRGATSGYGPRPAGHYLPAWDEVLPPVRRAALHHVAGGTWTCDVPEDVEDDGDEANGLCVPRDSAPATEDVVAAVEWLNAPRVYASAQARKSHSYPVYYPLMFLVAACTDLCQGEIWALRGKHIADHTIRVHQQLQWIDKVPTS